MNAILDAGLSTGSTVLLFVCLAIALGFEFVNGFHDTANAVATVIYTHSLRPQVAVVLSGLCNFTGVFMGGIAVAMGMVKLLPVELLVSGGPHAGLAMVLALLLSAIVWNLGTWYLGLPASSSHTLIGAIIGVGIANSLMPGHVFGDGVNWGKAADVGISLLVSPLFGFSVAFGLVLLMKKVLKNPKLFEPPGPNDPPPAGIRALLIATCSGVSFAHGSNDGQKGVGIVMLILMGLVPTAYALDPAAATSRIERTVVAAETLEQVVREGAPQGEKHREVAIAHLGQVREKLSGKKSIAEVEREQRFTVRQAVLLGDEAVGKLVKGGKLKASPEQLKKIEAERKHLRSLSEYAPTWVMVAIALALGIGTMFGWKRIVVTVGEKIGKAHLTYAQGASAELVAMSTIGVSAWLGLPVSTTHVLSSGVAGTMVAQRSGLQRNTVKSIGAAWVLTLPATMLLSGVFFLVFRAVLA